MEIKAQDVAKLRAMTGAGMMDCKNALVEANGDFERAKEIIREKGKLVAAKRADRETTEGAIIAKISADNTKGILVALGCETDFVAKNAEFQALATSIADVALEKLPADKDALLAMTIGERTVEEMVTEQTGKTGEKHSIAGYARIDMPFVAAYVHFSGKDGAIVGFSKAINSEVGREIAMQITSMKPVSISKADCPKEVIEKEIAFVREQMKQDPKMADKPDAQLDQIAQGKLGKFFKESTLEEQVFVKDGKISVTDYLKSVDKDVKVVAFQRFSLSE